MAGEWLVIGWLPLMSARASVCLCVHVCVSQGDKAELVERLAVCMEEDMQRYVMTDPHTHTHTHMRTHIDMLSCTVSP